MQQPGSSPNAPPNEQGKRVIPVSPVEADRINLKVLEDARAAGRRIAGVSVTHNLHKSPYGAVIFVEIVKAFVDGLHESIEEED
jgi:hypothetical protein